MTGISPTARKPGREGRSLMGIISIFGRRARPGRSGATSCRAHLASQQLTNVSSLLSSTDCSRHLCRTGDQLHPDAGDQSQSGCRMGDHIASHDSLLIRTQIAYSTTSQKTIMSTPAIIITTVKLRPGMDEQFTAWKAHNDLVIGKFPGFVSSDIFPPTKPGSNEWTIILNFRSNEDLVVWQKSKERTEIIAEGVPLFEGGNFAE